MWRYSSARLRRVPHKAVDILRNRYGDCKDHVALFGALLQAVGIRSEPVLLNLGFRLHIADGAGLWRGGAINHVISLATRPRVVCRYEFGAGWSSAICRGS